MEYSLKYSKYHKRAAISCSAMSNVSAICANKFTTGGPCVRCELLVHDSRARLECKLTRNLANFATPDGWQLGSLLGPSTGDPSASSVCYMRSSTSAVGRSLLSLHTERRHWHPAYANIIFSVADLYVSGVARKSPSAHVRSPQLSIRWCNFCLSAREHTVIYTNSGGHTKFRFYGEVSTRRSLDRVNLKGDQDALTAAKEYARGNHPHIAEPPSPPESLHPHSNTRQQSIGSFWLTMVRFTPQ
eukprot:1191294-Prorocentrum_minimum.AAC.2